MKTNDMKEKLLSIISGLDAQHPNQQADIVDHLLAQYYVWANRGRKNLFETWNYGDIRMTKNALVNFQEAYASTLTLAEIESYQRIIIQAFEMQEDWHESWREKARDIEQELESDDN